MLTCPWLCVFAWLSTRPLCRCHHRSITTLNESLRTHQHQYHDLLEKSQIFYRRLVAVGETSGLEPLDGDDDNVLVGSLARTIARSQRPLGSSVINQDLDGQTRAAPPLICSSH